MQQTARPVRPNTHLSASVALACVMWSVIALAGASAEQGGNNFKGRLSAVPIDFVTVQTTQGVGAFTAVLEGNMLSIDGTFEGLNSPATAAHVHRAFKGLRGPSVFALTVTNDTHGRVLGNLTLTDTQLADLRTGWLYVQIHTDVNPDGHLRGWILDADQGDLGE